MKKYIILFFLLIAVGAAIWHVYAKNTVNEPQFPAINQESKETADNAPIAPKTYANLEVPYINEAPENIWTGSWKNACEEATIAMVQKYYQGIKTVSILEAKEYLQMLFDFQKQTYGSDANSDVARTAKIIEAKTSFKATIVLNPTLEQIKNELNHGRPIIAFHRGFDLKNKNIPFLATGSSYHTTVIKGYDDKTGQFITNDPGDTIQGLDHVYDYDLFLKSIHDYNYQESQANGPARVLFTSRI